MRCWLTKLVQITAQPRRTPLKFTSWAVRSTTLPSMSRCTLTAARGMIPVKRHCYWVFRMCYYGPLSTIDPFSSAVLKGKQKISKRLISPKLTLKQRRWIYTSTLKRTSVFLIFGWTVSLSSPARTIKYRKWWLASLPLQNGMDKSCKKPMYWMWLYRNGSHAKTSCKWDLGAGYEWSS